MDRISGLSDELLVKILSFVPTKVAVSTSILSKRWEFLWMWLTKLEFGDKLYSHSEFKRLWCFLDRNMPLHRAPVIESFCLELSDSYFHPEGIKLWVLVAVSRYVRELDIVSSYYLDKQNILPSSLHTCKSLVILKFDGRIIVDVPRMVCLPSLKSLKLHGVRYFNEESFQRLLSNCPVLEDLFVHLRHRDNMGKLTVIAPSLHRLSLSIGCNCDLDGFVIDTHSLEYFKLVDHNYDSHPCLIKNMPKLMVAYVNVKSADLSSLIGSITSVKHLTICSKAVYGDGFIFNHLEHLMLCVWDEYSSNLLVRFLKDSPNLRGLSFLSKMDNIDMFSGNQPSAVPECMLSSLQNFTWLRYFGRPQERDIAVYILKNACRLRTAIIVPDTRLVPELEMISWHVLPELQQHANSTFIEDLNHLYNRIMISIKTLLLSNKDSITNVVFFYSPLIAFDYVCVNEKHDFLVWS